MGTPTYTALATATLGSAVASFTFGSIPATYRDLIVITNMLNSSGDVNSRIRFNADTGSNYITTRLSGSGGAATSANLTATSFRADAAAFANGTNRINHVFQFIDYSATDKHKHALLRANVGFQGTDLTVGRYTNTAAITSITFFFDEANIAAGSRLDLYGIVS
jgi:hypothetical protein